MSKKVTVVGAGNVGATTAQRLAEQGLADVVLVDVVQDMPQGKSLDILQSGPILGFDSQIVGTNDYEATAGSDLVVITAGVARKPGMSRDDLLTTNMNIVGPVVREVVQRSPECVLLVVTNPLDAMAHHALEVSGFPRERVIGMAGILDTGRFRTFIAQEMGVSVKDVQAWVLGGHGDTMVPLVRYTSVGGVPIGELLPKETVERLVERTRQGGGEIVKLLKTGSAYYAPSAAVLEMAEAMLLDRKRILPCSVSLNGEYGLRGVFMGVPVVLGAGGVQKVIELKLTPEEKAALEKSAGAVQEVVESMHRLAA
jgi:malate dehydrogenase